MKFLENLEKSIHSNLRIIDACDSRYALILDAKGQMSVPVGVINDEIEVVFLHYKSKEEAYEKWMRRCERININNLIIKFSEMNMCNEMHLKRFEELDYSKKVLLLAKHHDQISSGVIVNRYTRNGEISNDTLYYDKFIDIEKLINS